MTDHNDRGLAKVAALLRQAEGTDNEHEAEAFLAAAQRLATAASIDLALARAHTSNPTQRTTPEQRSVAIGEPGTKGLRTYVALFIQISRANQVHCDVARNSTYVLAYGFSEDINAAETLYASLMVQMAQSCQKYLTSGAHHPTSTITARLNFQLAFAQRIGERLSEARAAEQQKSRRGARGVSKEAAVSTALVLRNKELELTDYYQKNSTARGSWQPEHSSNVRCAHSRRAGAKAGETARLRDPSAFPRPRRQLRS